MVQNPNAAKGLAAIAAVIVIAGVCMAEATPSGRLITESGAPFRETPVMNLPMDLREHNWGGGSCVHASTVMCLRWQGRTELAEWWRKTYSGGESLSGLTRKLDKAGMSYAYTNNSDMGFLEWADRTRRGAVLFFFPSHCICFCGFSPDKQTVYLLDNNRIGSYIQMPRGEFERRWRGYGGIALTPIASPTPPLMWVP